MEQANVARIHDSETLDHGFMKHSIYIPIMLSYTTCK